MRVTRAWLLLGLILVAGCGGSGRSVGDSSTFEAAVGQARGLVAGDYGFNGVNGAGANGAIVAVSCPQGSWAQAFGVADTTGSKTPMRADMQFRIASNSKVFAAVAILRLVDMGLIQVTDPIGKYLDNPNPAVFVKANWDQITIQDLATHTSGIADYGTAAFNTAQTSSPYAQWTPLQILSYVPSTTAPGNYTYANANYVLLGMLIETVTGQDLQTFYREQFFQQLGLTHTIVPPSGFNPLLSCHGYSDTLDETNYNPSWAFGAGNLVSNAQDMVTWINAVGSGRLLSPASQQTLDNLFVPNHDTAFGIQVYGGWYGHTGRIEGYSSACFYNPAIKASVVVMVNRFDGSDPGNNINRELIILSDVIGTIFPNYPATGLTSAVEAVRG